MSREDNATCECGKPIHRQHNPPCEHGADCCDTCERVDVCRDCRRDEHGIGPYDPDADPLFIPQNQPEPYVPLAYFCATHNRPRKACDHD